MTVWKAVLLILQLMMCWNECWNSSSLFCFRHAGSLRGGQIPLIDTCNNYSSPVKFLFYYSRCLYFIFLNTPVTDSIMAQFHSIFKCIRAKVATLGTTASLITMLLKALAYKFRNYHRFCLYFQTITMLSEHILVLQPRNHSALCSQRFDCL